MNPHTLRYRNLNPARLPIPPLVRRGGGRHSAGARGASSAKLNGAEQADFLLESPCGAAAQCELSSICVSTKPSPSRCQLKLTWYPPPSQRQVKLASAVVPSQLGTL